MKFEIIGNIHYVDERLNFIISDISAFEVCRIDLCVVHSWSDCPSDSYACYEADSFGEINLAKAAPVKGTYSGIDSMGLFAGLKDARGSFNKRKERDFTKEFIECKFTVTYKNQTLNKTIIRSFLSSEIECIHLNQLFRGVYFYHKKVICYHKVVLLGGSEGVINPILPIAACLANKGFNVLALQYFDPDQNLSIEPLVFPRVLETIPVDYVESAIDWLKGTDLRNKVYLLGVSKGAELALLTASLNRSVSKVIAISPSAYVNQGLSLTHSSWSYQNKPLPYIHYIPLIPIIDWIKNVILQWMNIEGGYFMTYEISRMLSFHKELKRIKVENIQGDVCLIAGKRDSMWNSVYALKLIKKIMDTKNKEHIFWGLVYEECGHEFYTPFIFPIDSGFRGKKPAIMKEYEDFWQKVIEFLKD
ncbi:acyl-CoA thioesterase/bile acid-CoA:amino acid N-acyltransferase family protein [Anaerocolumna sp. AGMB13025]|uniref:acyl-CoA thioesterase/bile acid-CoA:amino acid N-acyltransferase family protein n=1 Tax=Anaerocolumna sp. AGMB13025 TaxID=3039116 RepID=UPI00241C5792|nr:acyl-CoA thioesterase/bile acid-CoA:amino acid N-acyltransferase family protein [Anaerocolumna sp. AGMB13025]WFR57035.1 acyl-CoA thioesterase/bile acid-CoA:amino acid N-acyltransferase family protein [Anaerocolumna sp. AGMB13025]